MRSHRRLLSTLLVLLCLLTVSQPCFAHSMYQSAVLLDFHSNTVEARIELPPSRLEQVFGKPLRADTLPVVAPELQVYLLQRLHASTDGQPWTIRFLNPLQWEIVDGASYVVAILELEPPQKGSVRHLELTDDVITDTLANHVVLVSVRSDWNTSTFANDPELLGVLNGADRSIVIDREKGNWRHGFASVFHLGTRHIAEGTDHLLFLLALLLPAPLLTDGRRWSGFGGVRHGFMKILQVVTAFTVGHSITLALAAFGLVHVPASPIEILIAVSILVSAVHALRPIFPGKEAAIAGSFGLIHGLAFASTLAGLGLHRWERVASIFAFNLGIEAMQLAVVACVMPSLMLLSRTKAYMSFRVVGALSAAFAATGWIIERSFQRDLHVDRVVDGLSSHAIVLATALFVASLLGFLLEQAQPLSARK